MAWNQSLTDSSPEYLTMDPADVRPLGSLTQQHLQRVLGWTSGIIE